MIWPHWSFKRYRISLLAPGLAASAQLLAPASLAVAQSNQASPGRNGAPAIVLVHGRGQQGRTIGEVRQTFVNAFHEAQVRLLGHTIVPASNVVFVWYADVIDPAAERPPNAATCNFAESVGAEAVTRNKDLRDRLIILARQLNLDGPVLRSFTEDTYKYLSSGSARCEADARLEQAIADAGLSGRPLVIVAHSMGGIVSFGSIAQNARSLNEAGHLDVRRFVTLGTQVGEPVILRGLEGTYVNPPVPEPNTIQSWTNFMNRGDRLAFAARSSFKASDAKRLPRDVQIDAAGERHAITTYLSEPRVARAILFAWCRAYPGTIKPQGCNQVEALGDVD